ncbi:MAG: DUF4349 domain-containing protein [Protaetiibacter sp.]
MRHIPRTTAALAAVLAAGIALAGCSAGSSGASDRSVEIQQAPQAVDGGVSMEDGAVATPEDQALVITGTVTITAEDPIAAAEKATAIALAAGGRVDARTEYAPRDGDAGSATLTLRVPATAVEDVRGRFTELGSVDETDFETVSVGERQRDLDSRITTLRTSIARYTTWLADADTTADLIALESAISDRQSELESLEAQQRALADQVAMSTITVTLRSEALAPPPEGPTSFWEGLVAGWTAFAGFWAAVAVGLGVALPWLVLLVIVMTVVVVVARRAGRARPAPAPAVRPASGDDAPA